MGPGSQPRGSITLEGIVTPDGRVTNVRVLDTPDSAYNPKAVEAFLAVPPGDWTEIRTRVTEEIARRRQRQMEAATLRIRRQWPGCRVLVLTQHNRKEYVQRLLQAGASGYVLKKAGGAEVATAIRAVRDGHVYLGAEVADLVVEARVVLRLGVVGRAADSVAPSI